MARAGRQTHAKRQREFAKQDARRAKDERKAARKAAKAAGISTVPEDQSAGADTSDAARPATSRATVDAASAD